VASLIFFLPTVRQQNPQQQQRQVGQHAYAALARARGPKCNVVQGAWHSGLAMGTAIFWVHEHAAKISSEAKQTQNTRLTTEIVRMAEEKSTQQWQKCEITN